MKATAITGFLLLANLGTCITSVIFAEPWMLMICTFLFIPLAWANGYAAGRGGAMLRSPFSFGSQMSSVPRSTAPSAASRAQQRRRKTKAAPQ